MDELIDQLAEMLYEELSRENFLDLAKSINGYDGSFDDADIMDFEDAADIAGSAYEFGRSIVYGNVTTVQDPVRYNAYGNLETVNLYELENSLMERSGELAEWLLDNGVEEIDAGPLTEEIIDLVNRARRRG